MSHESEPDGVHWSTISIVIPTFNEEQAIRRTLNRIPKEALKQMGYIIQVLVVDGNSSDRTREIAEAAGAKVIIERSRGYGVPIRTGLNAVSCEYLVKADGDDTYPLEALPELMTIVERAKLDFLTTDRFSLLNPDVMSTRNRMANRVLCALVRILFGLKLRDTQSGMWILRADKLKHLVLKRNVTFSQELKIESACYARLRWTEVPIRYSARVGYAKFGTFWVGIRLVLGLLLLRFRYSRRRRDD